MRIPSNKIADVVRFFRDELKGNYEKEEIETFIAFCFEEYLNLKRVDIFLNGNTTISESELLKFNFAIKDLKSFKPIQYILGEADFYGLLFKVNQHVLIPRPETEELVQLIINENQIPLQELNLEKNIFLSDSSETILIKEAERVGELSILDIGTGSGCIPIALKKNMPAAIIYALDISEKALEVAKQNAALNKVKVEFFQHDILSSSFSLSNPDLKFDIIISNPPYICISEKEKMSKNVLDYEPHLALFVNDNDPLLFYRTIVDFALIHLKQKGKLYFEINQGFGLETAQMLENKGFKNILLIKDIFNNNRILKCSI